MSLGVKQRSILVSIVLAGLAVNLGTSGCPMTGPPISLLHQVYERVQYGWRPAGTNDIASPDAFTAVFQPTAAGRNITIMLVGSSSSLRIPAGAGEGVSTLAIQLSPTSSTTTLTFVSQSKNVHRVETGAITGDVIGDTITVDVTEQ